MSTGLSGTIAGIRRTDPLQAIIGVVVIAGIILIAKKSGVPMAGYDAIAVGLLLGIAALGAEYYLSKEATRSFVHRSLGSMLVFGLLWLVAFAYGISQWIGAASENEGEKARAQKASFVASERANTALSLAEAAAAEAGRRAENLRAAAWESLPKVGGRDVTTVAEAAAHVDAAKNHRWWNYTKSCTEPRGAESQKFCTGYREALAAVPAAERREVVMLELAAATKEHDARRREYVALLGTAGSVRVESSGQRDDLRILMTYGGLDEQQASDFTAFGKIFIVSALLSGLGIMVELREHRHTPRQPWPWTRAVLRVWRGRKAVEVETVDVVALTPVAYEPDGARTAPVPTIVKSTITDRAFARRASDVLAQFRPKQSSQIAA